MKTFSEKYCQGSIHFVGIGGCGMSSIALILHELGYLVTGSDLNSSFYSKALELKDIRISYGHDERNLEGAWCVVVSSAVDSNNVEIQCARKRLIPVFHRSIILAWLMRTKFSIAVCGSYGKTTTTALIGHALEAYDPTVINGGVIVSKGTNAYIGKGNLCVVEADESDASFLNLSPDVSVITSINREHLNTYGSFENCIEAFYKFMSSVSFLGFSVVCLDDLNIRKLMQKFQNSLDFPRVITYGLSQDADIRAFNVRKHTGVFEYDVSVKIGWMAKASIYNVKLPMVGEHNILNSLAALAVSFGIGVDADSECFLEYKGVKRRCTIVGSYLGAKVIDDYGVHPIAIKKVIEAVKTSFCDNGGKLFVIWQPHRYSRITQLDLEFFAAFELADCLYVTPVFAAWENCPQDFSLQDFIKSISNTNTGFVHSLDELKSHLSSKISACDIVLFLGAGDITYWAADLVNCSKNQHLIDQALGS